MADDWCDVMEMARAGCAHCRPRAERARLDQQERDINRPGGVRTREVVVDGDFELGPAALAKFAGTCPACRCGIAVGETIRQTARGWVHAACL